MRRFLNSLAIFGVADAALNLNPAPGTPRGRFYRAAVDHSFFLAARMPGMFR